MSTENDLQLIGKYIIVGINRFNLNEQLLSQEQFSGKITNTNSTCIEVTLTSGEVREIPASHILDAPRGKYESIINGEVVTNPDYLTSWCVQPNDDSQQPFSWSPNYSPIVNSSVTQEWEFTYYFDPEYINHLIETKREIFLNKHLLIGIIYIRNSSKLEEIISEEQVHGHITRISFNEGIVVLLNNGEQYTLPPDLTLLQPAKSGKYVLSSTGERIYNVDFVTKHIITLPNEVDTH